MRPQVHIESRHDCCIPWFSGNESRRTYSAGFFRNTSTPSSMYTVAQVLPHPTKSHTCVCLPASVYSIYTQELYPDNVAFPGDVCDFSRLMQDNMTGKSTRYAEWQCTMKWHVDQSTKSSSLIHRFLSLIQRTFKTTFLNVHIAT